MPKYAYIVAYVDEPNIDRAVLLSALAERATKTPVPDIHPIRDPGCISFEHVVVTATDCDDAYLQGQRALEQRENAKNWNDYVVYIGPDDPPEPKKKIGVNRLFHNCILLGIKNGWRYWKLERRAAEDPTFVPELCDKLEAEAKNLYASGDDIGAYCLEAWAKDCRAAHQKYHGK